jgi:hypothetical protein
MRKNYLLLGALLITGILVYLAWNKADNKSTITGTDASFAVADTAGITRIFISNKQGGNYKLDRQKDGSWTINDSIEANPININLLLATIRNVEVKRNLNEAERNTTIKQMATEHLKVEIYVKNELFKTYYVGGTTLEYMGTYFLMDGSETPYVVYLRDLPGFLVPRYAVSTLGWRSRRIFGSNPTSIQSVSVTYPSNPEENFKIIYQNKKFTVEGAKKLDTLNVAEYLTLFKGFYAEQFFESFTQDYIDSLYRTPPMAIIELEDLDKYKSCKLYTYPGELAVSSIGRWETQSGTYWVGLQSIKLARFLQSRKVLVKE